MTQPWYATNPGAIPETHRRAPFLRLLEVGGWAALGTWAVAFLTLGFPWTMTGFYTDGLSYLSIANALTTGIGDPLNADGALAMRLGRFPPGYPAFLSLFGAERSAPGMQRANLAQMASVVLMIGLCGGYLRQRLGCNALVPFALMYLVSLPFVQPWALELTAEPLFTAIVIAIAWLSLSKQLPRRWLWIALLLGIGCLIRTLGVVLIPCAALWIWHHDRSWKRAAAAAAIAAAPIVSWQLFQWHGGQQIGSTYVSEYASAIGSAGLPSPETVLANATAMCRAFVPRYLPYWPGIAFALVAAVLLLVRMPGARRSLDLGDLSLVALLATLLLWPFPGHQERLAGPAAPFLAALIFAQPARAESGALPGRAWATAARALVLLAGTVGFVLGLARLLDAHSEIDDPTLRPYARNLVVHNRSEPMQDVENFHRILLASQASAEIVGPSGCMTAAIPALARLRATTAVGQLARPFDWDRNGCEYVLATNIASPYLDIPALYPLHEPDVQGEMVLVSRFANGQIAAALIRRRASADIQE